MEDTSRMEQPPAAILKTIRIIDSISEWSGRVFCWMVIPLMLGLSYEVIARYVFDAPTIWAYEVAFMLYGGPFVRGAAYAHLNKGLIRAICFYEHWAPRRKGWV